LPIAATIVSEEVEAKAVERGFFHVTSHVSDPLPAAVGLAVLEVIIEEGLVGRAAKMGQLLREGLEDLAKKYEVIGHIRGRGLLLGVEIVKDRETREPATALSARITDECLKRGLSMNLVRGMGASVWRIAPPLMVSEDECGFALDILSESLRSALDGIG
jgi:2,2-dialkylglycine decarboxylase (pyruvate)